MADLLLYDKACAALAKAKSVDEAKKIRDHAEAMRAYARQAKNRTLEVDAAEIRIRAERRVGELIAAQKALPREKGVTPTRWCTGPCRRLLSVVAFSKGSTCDRCRRNAQDITQRALAAFARHLALPPSDRVARRRTAA